MPTSTVKISELPSFAGDLSLTDIFPFNDDPSGSPITKKAEVQKIADLFEKGIFASQVDTVADLVTEEAASGYARIVSDLTRGGVFKAVDGGVVDSVNIFASATSGWTWQRLNMFVIYADQHGAVGDKSTDNTSAFLDIIDYAAGAKGNFSYEYGTDVADCGALIILGRGVYRTGKLTWKTGVYIQGQGSGTIIQANDNLNDDLIYIRDIQNYGFSDICFDGNKSNQTSGHLINSSYTASQGINATYNNVHLQNAKQNGIQFVGTSHGGGAFFNNMRVSACDGIGIYSQYLNDAKWINTEVRICKGRGIEFENTKTNHWVNTKVWKCRVESSTVTNIIPVSATESADVASVIICGHNHTFDGLELQENGSIGLRIGSSTWGCYNSTIRGLCVDGNGGYDPDASAGTQEAYRRDGLQLVNYYNVKISGVADDFRARQVKGRQNRGVKTIGTIPTWTSGTLQNDQWYKITDNSGGADFTNLQGALASPSNAVGTIFQVQTPTYTATAPTDWGTGELSAVNDYAQVEMMIMNQWEQNQGTGTGYDFSTDGGHSLFRINAKKISTPNRKEHTETIDCGTVNFNTTSTFTVTITGVAVGQSVICNPRLALGNGVVLAYARVSATDTVEFALRNSLPSTNATLGSRTFDFTVFIPNL